MGHANSSAALDSSAALNSSAALESWTSRLRPDASGSAINKGFSSDARGDNDDSSAVLDSSAALESSDMGGKGFRSNAGGKGFRSEVSDSAGSKGFSANTGGKGLSLDAGGSAGDEENNDDKDKVTYVFNCKIYIEIIAIKPSVDSADRTHALGRRLLPDGETVIYDLIVLKSTVVHGHPPDGCTWDDLPNNNSFP